MGARSPLHAATTQLPWRCGASRMNRRNRAAAHWNDVRDARTHSARRSVPAMAQCNCAQRGAVYFVLPQHSPRRKTHTARLLAECGARRPPETSGRSAPLRKIVVRLRAMQATPDKAIDAYRVQAGAVTALQAEVYNFEAAAFQGTLQLSRRRLESGARPCDRGGRSG